MARPLPVIEPASVLPYRMHFSPRALAPLLTFVHGRSFALVALLCSAALGYGCRSAPPREISLQGVSLAESTDSVQRYDLTLTVTNPNPDDLPLREATYSVTADGQVVFTTRASAQATVPPLQSTTIKLPFVVSGRVAGGRMVVSGSLQYLAPGALAEALFDTGFRKPEQPFSFAVDLASIDTPQGR